MIRPQNSTVETAKPVVAPYGILGSASTVENVSSDHWLANFTHHIYDAGVSAYNTQILGGTVKEEVVNADGTRSILEHAPFMITTELGSTTFGANTDDLDTEAKAAMNIVQQKAVEAEFWDGAIGKAVTGTQNRWLASDKAIDLTPTPGTGVKPRIGQALLEGAFGRDTLGYRGVIHTPREVASTLLVRGENGALLTNLDTPLIAGTGYSTTGPDGTPAPAGSYWMYGTGPVTVLLGEAVVIPGEKSQAVDTRINSIKYYVQKPAAVVWSTTHVFAVLVDLTLDNS